MDELIQQYKKSLADKVFSRKEKQAIIRLIREKHYDKHQLARLRSQIFDIARNYANEQNLPIIIDWLEIANKTLLKDNQKTQSTSEVYFSPGDACLHAIIGHLESAQSTLKICVFTISDNRISDTLIQCFRDGVQVRIITDNDKAYDRGSDIQRIAEAGVEVRVDHTKHHMHHKFAIIDNRRVITGSYNWTHSAALYNQENILISDEKIVVTKYIQEFKRLWKKMKR
jgi:phosphatidylserine/phosphatidylglycerophosphate/cardiolipin synthase-like enzyme